MLDKILFKVEKWMIPEYGRSTQEWEKYFIATSRETLESVLRDRYGSLKNYCSYDREEMEIRITEVEVETL